MEMLEVFEKVTIRGYYVLICRNSIKLYKNSLFGVYVKGAIAK